MPNTLLTPVKILDESLMILENNLAFTSRANRDYSDQFAVSGAKIGATVNARKPNRFVGTTGAALNIENVNETSTPITLTTQFHVDFTFSSQELTLIVDEFADRYLKPAMATIANKIDFDGLGLAANVANNVGTVGTTPNDIKVLLDAGVKLDNEATPRDGRRTAVWDPATNGSMVKSAAGLFNPSAKIGEQYESGIFSPSGLGFDIGMDQNVNTFTTGTRTNGTVSGAGQTGSSLLVTGLGAGGTVKKGDTFTIAGVFGVNPQNRQSTGVLRQFTVLADATADGSGNATLSIFPAINTAASNQQYQTVSAGPANAAAVTWDIAASTQYVANLTYHRDAFTLATADLEDVSKYGAWGARRVHKGISMRIARQYAIGTDTVPCRIDVLYGWAAIYPELACRIVR
ncbi:P22 phage major capsid protein family protein [Burkholderia vietnamiensis]|uniref:P22 phage major capsid protein family protein n=1 Tax=Burkholderia vietnamiensis TaxID=60552 RepID=UPI00264F121F|nr:P22 phage major capsid protein family protein [Burkholderia vietnamiensis]MDN8066327.1 P22 phage major capsid protein family protein [Burkholderia vietnamiensis]